VVAAGCSDDAVTPYEPSGADALLQPAVAASYTAVTGNDWTTFSSTSQLRSADLFYGSDTRNTNDLVDLVPDATFGQVARIRFPRNSGSPGESPRLHRGFSPLNKMWYRWRMKYEPGWTTVGADPAGHANSYKVAFWLWEGFEGRGNVEITNSIEYNWGLGVNNNGNYLNYNETNLPGAASEFGRITTEWTDNEWWEFVVYYEKTGPTTARQYYWRRRLTNGGKVVNNSWVFTGQAYSGATTPRVRAVELGANKNKNNPQDMFIYWGPWEVVDGEKFPNPFNMPNLQ
jgi:hypothetical protein